jgi:hypothetical protein
VLALGGAAVVVPVSAQSYTDDYGPRTQPSSGDRYPGTTMDERDPSYTPRDRTSDQHEPMTGRRGQQPLAGQTGQSDTADTVAELVDVAARNYDVLEHQAVLLRVVRDAIRDNNVELIDLGRRIDPQDSRLFHDMVKESEILSSSRDALSHLLTDSDAEIRGFFRQRGIDPDRIQLLTVDLGESADADDTRGGMGVGSDVRVYYYYEPQ